MKVSIGTVALEHLRRAASYKIAERHSSDGDLHSLSQGSKLMQKIINVLTVVILVGFAKTAAADGINYADFSSTTGLSLQGAAARSGNMLRMTATSGTSAGSA